MSSCFTRKTEAIRCSSHKFLSPPQQIEHYQNTAFCLPLLVCRLAFIPPDRVTDSIWLLPTSSTSAFMSSFLHCVNMLSKYRLFNLQFPAGLIFFKFQVSTHLQVVKPMSLFHQIILFFGKEVVWNLQYQNATHIF